jgi:hypothetical protein
MGLFRSAGRHDGQARVKVVKFLGRRVLYVDGKAVGYVSGESIVVNEAVLGDQGRMTEAMGGLAAIQLGHTEREIEEMIMTLRRKP